MATRDDILAIPNDKLRGGGIAADYLVFMDFVDSPKRWWTGWGDLVTEGYTWQGTGDIISVPKLPNSMSDTAQTVAFTVQGVTDEMLALAEASEAKAKGQTVIVYQQFFDVTPDDDGVQPWSPLMPAFALYTGKMDQLSLKSAMNSEGTLNSTITITANGLFTNRNSPQSSRWSDADQKAIYGDTDRGCERMPIYENSYSPTL